MALWDKYQYRPGLVFYSPYSAYQFVARSRKDYLSPDGTLIDQLPELLCEFAYHGGEYKYTDPDTGATDVAADIRGHYFDLDQQAYEKDWSEDDRALVAKRILWWADQAPADVRLWSKPPIGKPWPKYDETHHKSIPTLADQLGLVAEALAYEKENKARQEVVQKLEELLAQPEGGAVEELTAA